MKSCGRVRAHPYAQTHTPTHTVGEVLRRHTPHALRLRSPQVVRMLKGDQPCLQFHHRCLAPGGDPRSSVGARRNDTLRVYTYQSSKAGGGSTEENASPEPPKAEPYFALILFRFNTMSTPGGPQRATRLHPSTNAILKNRRQQAPSSPLARRQKLNVHG